MIKKLFLPVGMLLALALGFIAPGVGNWVKNAIGNNALIIAIFLLTGYEVKLSELRFDRQTALIFTAGAILTLLLSPCLALGMSRLLRLETLALTGLVVVSSVPPTLSTGIVMTRNANGNAFLAMTITLGYNLLGVLTMPVMLNCLLRSRGEITTHPLTMFCKLFLLVLLPFLAGLLLHHLSKRPMPSLLGFLPSLCIVLLLLSFFADSREMLRTSPPVLLLLSGLAALLLHGLMLAVLWYGGRLCRFPVADCKALLFTAGSKTISITLATLAILHTDDGQAVVPCMVFYFTQMMLDSCLAGIMGKQETQGHN